jgi:hypothetical protein
METGRYYNDTKPDVREIDCENNIMKTEVTIITVHCRAGPKHMDAPGREIM